MLVLFVIAPSSHEWEPPESPARFKAATAKILETVFGEEGRPPSSIYDFVRGITAHARTKAHQDVRLELEHRAAKLMAQAA